MKTKLVTIVVLVFLVNFSTIFSQTFDKKTDLLLANFDLKPDEDDVMATAALACMLKHPDFVKVKYYAVIGAYGDQKHTFITSGIPNYYTKLFGKENVTWTNADANWNESVSRAKIKVVAILKAGGKVFVQEAGQSNFTYDVLQAAMTEGLDLEIIQQNVIIVQHSIYNEKNTTGSKLTWLRDNTVYIKIDDGNTSDNKTPGYRTKDTQWLELAKSKNNQNTEARKIWTSADEVCDKWESTWTNKWIAGGGIDFSDCVENWYIFNLGNEANDIPSFWSKYVLNSK